MTVDREQARRDNVDGRGRSRSSAADVLALLAELEQAERENWLLKEQLGSPDDPESWLSLKSRAEQAERERDEYRELGGDYNAALKEIAERSKGIGGMLAREALGEKS